jgi:hypothetical protein
VSDGVIVREPLAGTAPIPLSNVTEIEFEELQLRVAVSPAFTVDGVI